ncbi:MAG TPA: GAF domain-containing sensor histidine kinase [Methylomirabilota bacterium]|nr:GAF domain-containing sensor histidine kinase [Methylomirabilota bacterium]
MQPHASERRYLERQVAYARPIFLVLALVDLFEEPSSLRGHHAVGFIAAYLGVSLLLAALDKVHGVSMPSPPLAADIIALSVFLLLTPSVIAFLFVYLFVALAAGTRWGLRRTVVLAGAATLALLVRAALRGPVGWPSVVSLLALTVGTFSAGIGLAYMGDRDRRHAAEHELLARLSSLMNVDTGVTESLRRVLDELARNFDCAVAFLVFRDAEIERIFLWAVRPGDEGRLSPENLPLHRGDGFLLDTPDVTLCWNSLEGAGDGFGWDRRNGRPIQALPRVPGPAAKELGLRSLLSVTFDFNGLPAGRIILANSRRRFVPEDLRWLERITRHLSPSMENLFLLRHMRARAIEAERSRISREIHDGILQTLLSVDIQMGVIRKRLPQAPQPAAEALASLQQTVRNETEELRQMVTDMRPLRVQSADLVDLMRGFAERFRTEPGPALDLLIDSAQLQIPDRICRDLFQVYRESLHNVKKHAHATHVVVKLWQNDTRVILVVDDNGEGFSFAGRFTGDELDRLRLGPISIKERTRSMGGVLTVESTPGHGSRLIVEIPLG